MTEQLVALAERCEKSTASDPERRLDGLIAETRGWRRVVVQGDTWFQPPGGGSYTDPPRYLLSLTATLTLKHPGDLWCAGNMEDGPFARVVPAMPGGHYGDQITTHAETVEGALASAFLRAASLRALAGKDESHD